MFNWQAVLAAKLAENYAEHTNDKSCRKSGAKRKERKLNYNLSE